MNPPLSQDLRTVIGVSNDGHMRRIRRVCECSSSMVPNGAHPVAPFAMNQSSDASLGLNQDLAQDQGMLNPNLQAQRLLQQNSVNPWQQTQLAMSANQQLPALNMLQFGQLPWPTQISNQQQLQNAMLQMAPFNMPLLSQQMIQEACSMSQPVDAADEPILLTALLKAMKSERNFKEALNGLHGVSPSDLFFYI
jgi:hypothetical protein